MENAEIAAILEEIADLLDIQEANQFRIRSYRNAAQTVRDTSRRIADLVANGEDLSELPDIGNSTADKIREMLERGTCQRLEELHAKSPSELTDFLRVPGLGPKKARKLHDELGVSTLDELKQAAADGRVRKLQGMGPKTEERILHGIENFKKYRGRIRVQEAQHHADSLSEYLGQIEGVKQWQIAGSYRRCKETIGDLDVLVQAEDRDHVAKQFTKHEAVADVLSKGSDKVRVRLRSGLAVDVLFFDKREFGSALLYFTGSKSHNIGLRKRARKHKWKLNEHGLFSGQKRLAGAKEADVYRRLKLPLIPPELREDRGEIEAAEKDALPKLIEVGDIRGDLHAHTTASDGKQTIEEMARAAKERGYDYLALTDHSKAVRVANGLDEDRLRKHADAIREVNGKLKGFRLLVGVEVDILKSGRLDLDENLLGQLDWVNAAVHSYFRLGKKAMTERVLKAVRSGVVDCIAHPFGRQLGIREPIEIDLDRVLEACAETGVCLEINAYPNRLDLPDIHCQRAKEAGVEVVISTDAHKIGDLDFMRYGVSVARRGWLEKKDVLNTVTAKTLEKRTT